MAKGCRWKKVDGKKVDGKRLILRSVKKYQLQSGSVRAT